MITFFVLLGSALAEIAGCFSFWAWIRLEKSILWLMPGTLSLWLFGYLLTFVDGEYAGRVYAAYGAVYICSSIIWMWIIENNPPDKFDILGILVCFLGSGIILFAPRS